MPLKPKKMKLKNLAAATTASVQAVLGKQLAPSLKGGLTVGLVLNEAELARLDAKPLDIAKDVAKQVTVQSGIRVSAQITKVAGGILVGYQIPRITKS